MKAIILAAGRSIRMMPLSRNMPKCLLPYGGTTILEYLLSLLKENGISDITIVNGFAAELLEQIAGPDIRYIHNPDYLTTNSLYSLYLARECLDSDFMLLNSDVIIGAMLLRKLLAEEHPNALLVDCDKILIDGEMNIRLCQGFVTGIGKDIAAVDADAESVQVCKFGKAAARVLREELIRQIGLGHVDKFPPFIYGSLIDTERIKAVSIDRQPWHEIDMPEDYHQACRDVSTPRCSLKP
jgi:choline kinase